MRCGYLFALRLRAGGGLLGVELVVPLKKLLLLLGGEDGEGQLQCVLEEGKRRT
jgi:hypothetical protein